MTISKTASLLLRVNSLLPTGHRQEAAWSMVEAIHRTCRRKMNWTRRIRSMLMLWFLCWIFRRSRRPKCLNNRQIKLFRILSAWIWKIKIPWMWTKSATRPRTEEHPKKEWSMHTRPLNRVKEDSSWYKPAKINQIHYRTYKIWIPTTGKRPYKAPIRLLRISIIICKYFRNKSINVAII